MAYGQPICACCGAVDGIEAHHLYLRSDGCPDDLTVWLCHVCHRRAHGLARHVNISQRLKATLRAPKAGTKTGNYTMGPKNAAAAAARDEALRDTLAPMVGLSSRIIAQRLADVDIAPPRGGTWSHSTVIRMMKRLGLGAAS
jgi:hypothetical protein